MHARARLLVAVALGMTLPLFASEPAPPGFLAGTWTGTADGLEMEELWTPARAGSMLGLHRDVRAGRTESFEFLRIEITPEAVTYWASPKGRPATPFRMIASESKGNRAVFANPEHDFPTRILYWLTPDGNLHARTEGTLNGKPASEEWSWKRSK